MTSGGHYRIERWIYGSFALLLLTFIYYLFYFDPVGYTKLITEDQWGEYTTSVLFLLAGMLLIILAGKKGPLARRVMWGLMGAVAIFIGGEEISWGQRIFDISSPDLFLKSNVQGETTLHNLVIFHYIKIPRLIAWALILWCFFSLVVAKRFAAVKGWCEQTGLPLIPAYLIPLFLLIPYCFFFGESRLTTELNEFLWGVAIAVWAVDLFNRYGWRTSLAGWPSMIFFAGVFLASALVSETLAYRYPDLKHFGWRLNYTALYDYSHLNGMHDQAETLYQYIYLHPFWIRADTRINHALTLYKMDRGDEAETVLLQALGDLANLHSRGMPAVEHLRRLGIIHTLLGQQEDADRAFDESIRHAHERLRATSDPDTIAIFNWSIAKTIEARGEKEQALEVARAASEEAASSVIGKRISRWIFHTTKAPKSDHKTHIDFGMMHRLAAYYVE